MIAIAMGRRMMIEKIRMCERCLQFSEDCHCCPECGGLDVHDRGCGAPLSTRGSRRAAILQRKAATLPGLALPPRQDTIRSMPAVVRVPGQGEVNGYAATTMRKTPVPAPARYQTLKVVTPYPPAPITPAVSTLPSERGLVRAARESVHPLAQQLEDSEVLTRWAKRAGISVAQARAFMAETTTSPIEQVKRIADAAESARVREINRETRKGESRE